MSMNMRINVSNTSIVQPATIVEAMTNRQWQGRFIKEKGTLQKKQFGDAENVCIVGGVNANAACFASFSVANFSISMPFFVLPPVALLVS